MSSIYRHKNLLILLSICNMQASYMQLCTIGKPAYNFLFATRARPFFLWQVVVRDLHLNCYASSCVRSFAALASAATVRGVLFVGTVAMGALLTCVLLHTRVERAAATRRQSASSITAMCEPRTYNRLSVCYTLRDQDRTNYEATHHQATQGRRRRNVPACV